MTERNLRSARPPVPPGPRGARVTHFFGNGDFAKTLDFLTRQTREHGSIVSFRVLGRRLYVLDDPELVREVLVVQQHKFARATGAALLREIVGTSVLTAEEPLHRARRRMLQPAFGRAQIATYAHAMLEEARATRDALVPEQTLDVGAAMTRLTLAVTGRTLFGADVGADAERMNAALARAMGSISRLGPVRRGRAAVDKRPAAPASAALEPSLRPRATRARRDRRVRRRATT